MRREYTHFAAVCRPVLGVVVGVFVLVFGAAVSVAAMDHALHHDAESHSGGCAVCSFAQSQVETTDSSVAIDQPVVPADMAAIVDASFDPQNPSDLLPLGRAPPILPAVS